MKDFIITYEVGPSLYVNLTNRCNNRCIFCVRDEESGGGYGNLWLTREPESDEVIASLKSRNITDYKEVVFCGYGEPTMRITVLLDTAKWLRENFPETKIRINTNGTANLFYKKDITPYLEGYIDVISISLNTASPEHYVEMCRPAEGIDAYYAMLDFAKKASKHIPEVVMSVVDTTISTGEIEECRRIAEACGAVLRVREYIE